MWTNPAFWTAIAGIITAITGLVAAFKINQKVNTNASQTPIEGSNSASDPSMGPKSLSNRYLDPWNKLSIPTRMVPRHHQERGGRKWTQSTIT